jgi:phage repressor protein C with HTH and peptisase S24 domain
MRYKNASAFCDIFSCKGIYMMTPGERLKLARQKAGYETAMAAAEAMGISVSTYTQHENGFRGYPADKAAKYARFFRTNPEYLLFGNEKKSSMVLSNTSKEDLNTNKSYISVPILDVHVSAGSGSSIENEEEIGVWKFDRRFLTEELHVGTTNLSVSRVAGDSMDPTLHDGDYILVDHMPPETGPKKDGIYVLYDGDGTVVKRIQRVPCTDPLEVVIISDNRHYKEYTRVAEDVRIVGRVVWYSRKM